MLTGLRAYCARSLDTEASSDGAAAQHARAASDRAFNSNIGGPNGRSLAISVVLPDDDVLNNKSEPVSTTNPLVTRQRKSKSVSPEQTSNGDLWESVSNATRDGTAS